MHRRLDESEAGSEERLKKPTKRQQPGPPTHDGDDSPNPLPDDLSEIEPEGGDPDRT